MNTPQDMLSLAVRLHEAGRLPEAERLYRALLAQQPGHPEALHRLGLLAYQGRRLPEALELLGQAVQRQPRNPFCHYNYGLALKAAGALQQAVQALSQAVRLKPDFAAAYVDLGVAQKRLGDLDAAIASYRAAVRIDPRNVDAWFNLGIAQVAGARYGEAIESYRKALTVAPRDVDALTNLGSALSDQGRSQEALDCYREALRIRPDFAQVHSNALFELSYNVLCGPEEMLAAHREWDRAHGADGRAHGFRHPPGGDPDKRLRIGYVSPDLWRHAVSYFFEPVLAAHDRRRVEVYCYAEVAQPDDVTRRLQGLADGWRSTVGLGDRQVAERIHADGIDILIDLAGHTSGNRLKAFTYKPAPVQATYLGYCTTTGLAAMDYWITDRVLHPADSIERAAEQVMHLDRCWLCYQPEPDAPPVLPRTVPGRVTFGSFNNLSKVTPAVIALWGRVLTAVPGSRLLLKTKQLADPALRQTLQRQFADHGIDPERLQLLPRTRDYLDVYNEIDIALDTFPRTGGATSADALWMGVPVITLAGARVIERQGASMLTALGLPELIAHSEDDYIAKAQALAADTARRNELRATLRQRMAASPLRDGRGLAQALERTYREMWERQVKAP